MMGERKTLLFVESSVNGFKLVSIFIFFLVFLPLEKLHSKTRPYINVGRAEVKQSPLALVPFIPLDKSPSKSFLKYGQRLYGVIKRDLTISSYFLFVPKEAFIEDYKKRSLHPKNKDPDRGFDFSSWNQMGVEFMIRSGFRVRGNQLQYLGYVYHVPQKN